MRNPNAIAAVIAKLDLATATLSWDSNSATTSNGWRIAFTGRTQLDAHPSPLPYIAAT